MEITDSELESIRKFYERNCEEWRHYDKLIWEVTNIAIVVNGFLIVNSFNNVFDNNIRAIIPFISAIFTFIFLIALTKHRLHQDVKTYNIRHFEEILAPIDYRTKFIDFGIENNPDFELLKGKKSKFAFAFRNFRAFDLLCWMMILTIIIDLLVMIGIIFKWW